MFERHQWRWYWGIWALAALYFTVWRFETLPEPANWFGALLGILVVTSVQVVMWALMGLTLLPVARRFPIDTWAGSKRNLAIQLGYAVLLTVAGTYATYFVFYPLVVRVPAYLALFWQYQGIYIKFHLFFNFFLASSVLSVMHTLRILRQLRRRELEGVKMETRFVQAQNQALRMQLQPHFLFNTLHSISTLVHKDPEAADGMLVRLGDLLRLSLESRGAQEVTLEQELHYLEHYLAIELIRFGERLKVRMEVPQPLRAARVPSLLLQPLVENAVKHGLAGPGAEGSITLRAREAEGRLCLEVEDDGAGFGGPVKPGGIGTTNTQQRLELLYGRAQTFELHSLPGKGTLARIVMPLRFAEAVRGEAP